MTPHAAYVRFQMGDKEEVACFVPGRTYVNGADNLLKFGRSQELLAAILDPDLDIKVQYFVKAILDILITCVQCFGSGSRR